MSSQKYDALKSRIKEASDIVEIVGEVVQLEKAGRNYKGLCPFHQEKTPSFHVNTEMRTYHCFGCGEGGDVFSFVEKMQMLDFREALRMLANRAGIPIVYGEEDKKISRILELNEQACRLFQANLQISAEARNYLASRKINPETIEKFRIGWSFNEWRNLQNQMSKYAPPEELSEAGLMRHHEESGTFYDIFRGRIIFPIFSSSGRGILGFGGRVLEKDAEPKYLNTPETPVFNKSSILYGFNFASGSARKQKQLILVEGYTDVMHAHQIGCENAAAVIGTALTDQHVAFLGKRPDLEIVICYDGDLPGIKSAAKSAEKIISRPKSRVWILPEGKDVADLCQEGKDFRKEVQTDLPAFEFLVSHHAKGWDIKTLEGKMAILEGMKPALSNVPSDKRGICLETLAQQTDISIDSVRRFMCLPRMAGERLYDACIYGRRRQTKTSLEIMFIQNLILSFSPDLVDYFKKQGMKPEDFSNPSVRAVYLYLKEQEESAPLFYSMMPLAAGIGLGNLIEDITNSANNHGLIVDRELIRALLAGISIEHQQKPTMADLEFDYLRMRTRGLANRVPRAIMNGKAMKDLIEIINEAEKRIQK